MPKIPRKYIPLILLFFVLVLFMPRAMKFNYDYRKGSHWPYETLVAKFNFPILKTEEQLREEQEKAGNRTVPYYRYSEETTNGQLKSLQGLDLGKYSNLRPSIVAAVSDIFSKGVISDADVDWPKKNGALSEEIISIQWGKSGVSRYPRSEVYKVSDAQNQLLALLSRSNPDVNVDSLFKRAGVYELIVPNLLFDRAMTEHTHAESAEYISPTSGYVTAEQKIVSQGETITPEIAQILDSYKAEFNSVIGYDGPRILLVLGDILIALAIVVILFFCIYFTDRDIFKEKNKYYYLLTVFATGALLAFIVERVAPSLMYLMPFTTLVMYLQAFFKKRVVLPIYMVSLLPLLLFSGNGVELFFIFLCAGVVAMSIFKRFSRGWLQFVNAFIIFGVELLVFFGFRLIDAGHSPIWQHVVFLLLGALLTVALFPLTYLFERVFNLVSPNKLLELTDTNNKLLQELSNKAPGTFQHSLQVMHMADEVGRSVHANVPLLKAAALYHDLGKMKNPQCFIENSTAASDASGYHVGKDPRESARDIIAHVTDGVEIAKAHNLPDVLIDFILTHHGTSYTAYFRNQYLNAGGDPSDTDDFYYHGRKPRTKEEVILMICDSVEAASRTLKEFTPQAFDIFVESMVDAKDESGQFEDAEITLGELNTVKSVLKTYLQQLYHERIPYPKAEVAG